MTKQPLAEVFGFPVDNLSHEAGRYREKRLCPFNNKVPNCTKDKANDPLGVCSVNEGDRVAITCPIRFREDWLIAEDADGFFFPPDAKWTSLVEVRLKDRHGQSAGNVDVVLVSYDDLARDEVVNVASVPQRSPFRYAGGKTWLVPRIRRWLTGTPAELIEPFAGGGIVGLTAAAECLAGHVTMVEVDEQVAAVWRTIVNDGQGVWLAERVAGFELTVESLKRALGEKPLTVRERAFQTILKNRTFRGGILAPGSAPLKYGENGRGIQSRWYPETLRRRILDIQAMSERLMFIEGDGLEVIKQNACRTDVAFFIDPPYTAAGKKAGRRLYTHFDLDHNELFHAVSGIRGDFLMTYDDSGGVRELAARHGFDTELIAMKNTHHTRMKELLIGFDLSWLRVCDA
ncbi:MAG TPA: NotI family restriction endonuclease [Pyrinomonadaceae bacterium]|nr:NotI family restriction endonuclease [Pyrinomonadaceae bacterium]